MKFWKQATCVDDDINIPETEAPTPDPEWIWVEGYKGTDGNMCCNDYQYELNKHHIFEGEIEICHKGFHFCPILDYVFNYYNWNFSNRYFKVKALVKKRDFLNEGWGTPDKLVAKEIIFLEELDRKEVFKQEFVGHYDWITADDLDHIHSNDEYKAFAISKIQNLLEGKYSPTFLTVMRVYDRLNKDLVNKMIALYDEGVSPDMRAYLLRDYL